MAVLYGFFNSVGGDRLYDATSINNFFKGFVQEGVLGPVGDWLQVTALSGMTVEVGTGKAWFLDTWIENTQPLSLSLAVGDVGLDRIDIVALDFNIDARQNSIVVLTGTPAASPSWPTLIDTARRKQVPLAIISVGTGATTIVQGDIENKIGTTYCPFATGLLQQATTDDLIVQWNSDYNNWKSTIEDDLQEIDTSGTIAELQDIRSRPVPGRNIIINGDMRVNQRGVETHTNWDYTDTLNDPYVGVADRWQFNVAYLSGGFTVSRVNLGNGLYSLKAEVTQPVPTLPSDGYVYFRQLIEGSRLGDWQKGTSDCKNLKITGKVRTNYGGTMVLELIDRDNNRSISNTNMVLNTGGTFTHFGWTVPEDFVGEIDSDENASLEFIIWMAAGSNFDQVPGGQSSWATLATNKRAPEQSNWVNTTGNYLEITDVQIEVGSIFSEYDRRPLQEELRLCRRYREVIPLYIAQGVGDDTNDVVVCLGPPYSEEKRAIPTASFSSAGWGTKASLYSGSYSACTDMQLTNPTADYHRRQPTFYVTPQTWNGSDNAPYFVSISNLLIDAELT